MENKIIQLFMFIFTFILMFFLSFLMFDSYIGLMIFVFVSSIIMFIIGTYSNFHSFIMKYGYISKKDYFKYGYYKANFTNYNIYKVLCCFCLPYLNILLGPIMSFEFSRFNEKFLLNDRRLKEEIVIEKNHKQKLSKYYNAKCKCNNCGIITRVGYLKKYNKENNLNYMQNICFVCKNENTMEYFDSNVENKLYPVIDISKLHLYIENLPLEKQTMKSMELKTIENLEYEKEVDSKESFIQNKNKEYLNDLVNKEQKEILLKYKS